MFDRLGRSNPFASTQPFRDELMEHEQEARVPPVSSAGAWGTAGNGVGTKPASTGGFTSIFSSNGTATVPAVDGDVAAREEALRKREAELRKREEKVAAAEAQLGHKNWPRFKPFLRHSISEDVPPERRGLVWRNYWAWVLGAAGFGWNWLIVTIMFIASRKSLPNWLFASLISGFGLPGSFLFWHRNLYKAAITDGTFRWMMFTAFSFAQIITAGWTFVAPPVVGGWAVGLLTMIDQFKDGGGAGIFFGVCAIINMVLWGLGGLLAFWTLGEGSATFRGRPKTQPRPSRAQLRVLTEMADARL